MPSPTRSSKTFAMLENDVLFTASEVCLRDGDAAQGIGGWSATGLGTTGAIRGAPGLTVQLERADYDALGALADARGVSVGTVVREAVSAYLARRKKR